VTAAHRLEREQWLPMPPERVFPFFADAHNLERITPPWLGFRIATPDPIHIREAARLDYRLRLAGIPLSWRTVILDWKPDERFVDFQERGPYALWHHEHRFIPERDGTKMLDIVDYTLPLGPLGRATHAIAVRRALDAIFDYRFAKVAEIFGC
jgi:ligand-binding SRPBCC domain-containing protein